MVDTPRAGSVAERLRVYADGYPARVQEALAETFPAVAHVIGRSALASLTARYIRAVPLHSYNLSETGAALPAFLQQDLLSSHLPFLPDLARLEWRITEAFHAHEEPRLDPTPLAAWTLVDWERAVLRFQPAVALVRSQWPIRELWEARHTPVEEIDIDLRDRPDQVLVHRQGLDVTCESLGADEATALGALLEGHTLGAVHQMPTLRGCDAAAAYTWFARWAGLGLITGCTTTPHPTRPEDGPST